MGIDINFYMVFGTRVSCKENEGLIEKFEALTENGGKPIDYLLDFRKGEWLILGTILADSGNLRYGDFKDDFVSKKISELVHLENAYKMNFLKHFPEHYDAVRPHFEIMFVAQYT